MLIQNFLRSIIIPLCFPRTDTSGDTENFLHLTNPWSEFSREACVIFPGTHSLKESFCRPSRVLICLAALFWRKMTPLGRWRKSMFCVVSALVEEELVECVEARPSFQSSSLSSPHLYRFSFMLRGEALLCQGATLSLAENRELETQVAGANAFRRLPTVAWGGS